MSSLEEKRLLIERQHWWFSGRRRVMHHLAKRFLSQHANARLRICEIGCGTGVDLEVWEGSHDVLGVESESDVIPIAKRLLHGRVAVGELPNAVSLQRQAWDLVLLPDSLACVEDHNRAAEVSLQLLRPGGILIATVPSRFGYWVYHRLGHHSTVGRERSGANGGNGALPRFHGDGMDVTDEIRVAANRREPRQIRHGFSTRELRRMFGDEEYRIEFLSYFNFLPCRSRGDSFREWVVEHEASSSKHCPWRRPMNGCLRELLASERWVLSVAPIPFGSSLVAVVRRLTEAELVSERTYTAVAFEGPLTAKQVA